MLRTFVATPWILLALLLVNSSVLGKQPVLIYGDINYPPYSFYKEGRPEGIYVNTLRSAFARMPDYDVEIKMIPYGEVVLFGKEDDLRGKEKWPEDLYGSKVGLNTGYDLAAMGGATFASACKNGKIVLHEAYTTEANLRQLQRDKIQFFSQRRRDGYQFLSLGASKTCCQQERAVRRVHEGRRRFSVSSEIQNRVQRPGQEHESLRGNRKDG